MLQSVRDLRESLQSEARLQPLLLGEPTYLALHGSAAEIKVKVRCLGNILANHKLHDPALQVIRKHPRLYTSIKYVVPTFDESVVAAAAQNVREITGELDGLLMVFESHMPRHPGMSSLIFLLRPLRPEIW
jgi:hypothetical protein